MKRALFTFLAITTIFLSSAQQANIQCITYNEDNSSLATSVCYNWNQLTNGEFFVSGNAGIHRFDGINFHHFSTHGRGVAISSSVEDQNGRLWCNSFHGDIYYLENDSLIRHSISQSLRGLTILRVIEDQLFLFTERKLFEINPTTLKIQQVGNYNILREVFGANGHPFLINDLEDGKMELVDLRSQKSTSVDVDYTKNTACRFLKGETASFLFFDRERTIINVNDFLKGNFDRTTTIDYNGKINFVTLVDDNIVVCGMNGINIYSKEGKWIKHMLPEIQVTHFGKDQEGNYVATSISEGLILIPDMGVFRNDYSNYLHHENIIQSVFDQKEFLYLGTNAGKVLRQNIHNKKADVLNLGLRSEVLSMQLSRDGSELFVYCDNLYVLDVKSFKVKRKHKMSSVKQMALFNDYLVLGTRKGVELFDGKNFQQLEELGWMISILPQEHRNELLVSSKNGLFRVNMSNYSASAVTLKGINSDRTISNLTPKGDEVYFIYDHQTVYKCSENLQGVDVFYQHDKNDLNGMIFQGDQLLLFSKGKISLIDKNGKLLRTITELHGLNERYTVQAYKHKSFTYFVHNKSISVFNGLPRQSTVRPEISFVLSDGSTFAKSEGLFTSSFENNELVFQFNIRRALRSRGKLEIFYCFDPSEDNWKKIDNPYSEVRLERLPIGSGAIYFKAISEAGISSEVISVPYYVEPPFYLTIWFFGLILVALVIIVILVTKWRVQLVRKKNLERLRKEKLESRALHAELTAIRSQMNPHFIFNVLTAIQAKVIQGKIDEAYSNIGDFAVLIRNVLEKSGKEYISLDDEISLMKNYVELENSRLSQPIKFYVRIDESSDFEDVFIPTLITQPLIENAIKHAFTDAIELPRIVLEAKATSNGFNLTVSDNGSGFNTGEKSEDHDSFALAALRKRIRTLSITAPYSIELDILSGTHGTQVTFTFKYKQK